MHANTCTPSPMLQWGEFVMVSNAHSVTGIPGHETVMSLCHNVSSEHHNNQGTQFNTLISFDTAKS